MHQLKTMNPDKDGGRRVEVQFGGNKWQGGSVYAIHETGFVFESRETEKLHFISFVWSDTWRWPKPSDAPLKDLAPAELPRHQGRSVWPPAPRYERAA